MNSTKLIFVTLRFNKFPESSYAICFIFSDKNSITLVTIEDTYFKFSSITNCYIRYFVNSRYILKKNAFFLLMSSHLMLQLIIALKRELKNTPLKVRQQIHKIAE